MTFETEDTIYEKANGQQWKIVEKASHPEDEPPLKWKCSRWEESTLKEAIFAEDEITKQAPPQRHFF